MFFHDECVISENSESNICTCFRPLLSSEYIRSNLEEKVKADRKYKDALFAYIFGNEKHKEFALSLYNATNHSVYTNAEDLEIITPGKVVFIRMTNDVAYLFQSEMFLYEQQVTWNPNIPCRFPEYVAGEYQRYLSRHSCNRYSRRMFLYRHRIS